MEKAHAYIWEELKNLSCVCGNPKLRLQSFCRTCYFTLPLELRDPLWLPFICKQGDAFPTVYARAKAWLKGNPGFLTRLHGKAVVKTVRKKRRKVLA